MCEQTFLINTEESQEANHTVAVHLQRSLAVIILLPK